MEIPERPRNGYGLSGRRLSNVPRRVEYGAVYNSPDPQLMDEVSVGSWTQSYSRSLGYRGENVVMSRDRQSVYSAGMRIQGGYGHDEETTDTETLLSNESIPQVLERYLSVQSQPLLLLRTPVSPDRRSTYLEHRMEDEDSEADSLIIDEYGTSMKSNFQQTLFNSLNVLMGISIVSLPFAIKITGWIVGVALVLFSTLITKYTAMLLAKCLSYYGNSINTYTDLINVIYGKKIGVIITIFFSLDIFSAAVALVILFCDSMMLLLPFASPLMLKLLAFVMLTPTTFLPLKYLSYSSLLGIISVFGLTASVVVDGLVKTSAEGGGSIWHPVETDLWPASWSVLPFSFGLVMAGFAGHACFPAIYRDMEKPAEYSPMVSLSYLITTTIYVVIVSAGYLMFGRGTMKEITMNIAAMGSAYPPLFNSGILWLVAINPLTKYALELCPLNDTIEQWLGVSDWHPMHNSAQKRRCPLVAVLIRIAVSSAAVGVAILFPDFERAMGVLGSLFTIMICAVVPLACHLKLFARTMSGMRVLIDVLLLVISLLMAVMGTVWAVYWHID